MTPHKAKLRPIFSYPNNTLGLLYRTIGEQSAILQQIKAALPQELAGHALHCVIKGAKLSLYTDSAAWASQLRFYADAVLAASGLATTKPATVLQVKVMALPTLNDVGKQNLAHIPSQVVADEIDACSRNAQDPQLKRSLGRLSATLTRLQNRQ